MKVTKLIREYVTDEVSKVYNAKVNPYSKQAEIDRQKLKAFGEELRDQQREAIEKFISENELFEYGWGSEVRRIAKVGTSSPSFSYYYTQAMCDERQWNDENNKNKKAKIRDIILSLELGANKHELEAMLAELLKEA